MAVSKESFVNYGIEVRPSANAKGRGLFATRRFRIGDNIIEEEPLVSCQFSWNATYGYAACDFCMKPLETAEENARRLTGKPDLILPFPEADETDKNSHIVCPYCAVNYCKESCKEKAWNQYHQTICTRALGGNPNHPLEKLNEVWKPMHYPPETTSVMFIVRILASILQSQDKENLKKQLLLFCHGTINEEDAIAHKLLGKEFESQLEMLRDLTSKALPSSEISEFLTAEGFRSLFALIGRNGQGIGTSSFSVWVRNVTEQHTDSTTDELIDSIYEDMEKESGDFLNNEGSALFTVQSAANHHCEPNSTSTFPYSNHTVVLQAAKDIEENEEIFISYLDDCALTRSRHSRRKILQNNYLFNCECSRCQEEAGEPDVTSEEDDMEED